MKKAIFAAVVLLICFLPPVRAAEAPADSPSEPRLAIAAAADGYADELLDQPPEGLTRADIAMAFGWIHLFDMLGAGQPAKAEPYLQAALDLGLPEAGVVLASMYLGKEEFGGARDLPRAIAYYERAASLGSVDAERQLAFIYLDGLEDIPADPALGRRHLVEAARRGSEQALRRLEPLSAEAAAWEKANPGQKADVPSSLDGIPDPELAKAARERSVQLSEATARVFDLLEKRLAELEIGIKDSAGPGGAMAAEKRAELMALLKKTVEESARALIARQPDDKSAGEAALVVGVFHYMGVFHGVDPAKAREYMELALAKGVPEARVTLGELFLGFALDPASDFERDPARGLELLNAAAEVGSVDAFRLLGAIYAEGMAGIAADPAKSEQYFLAAARHGDAEALERLKPAFEKAAAWEAEHPGEKSPFPSSPEAVVDPALAGAAERRSREIAQVAEMVNTELNQRILEVMDPHFAK